MTNHINIKLFALWVILSVVLVVVACEQESTTQPTKNCVEYDYDKETQSPKDSVEIMLKKGYRVCE